jgi:hypothetical protein
MDTLCLTRGTFNLIAMAAVSPEREGRNTVNLARERALGQTVGGRALSARREGNAAFVYV